MGSGGRTLRLSQRCCLLSVPLGEQASGRRWDCSGLVRWPEGALAPNGTMMCRGHGVPEMVTPDCSGLGHVGRRCFGTKWYDDVPGARSIRDSDTGNEDNSSFVRFFKLDKK